MNITVFIIITIIPLLITILYYYGITRYIQLHYENPNKYIENYKNLPKIPDIENKIIISFTTTPDRIKKINPMLNSILDQTVKIDQIVLNIPGNCKGKTYNVPNNYKNIMNIITCEKDYGPATKFIPTILREDNADTIIILLDDDTIYGKDFIETIVEESKKNKDKTIISKKSILLKPSNVDPSIINKNGKLLRDNWIIENLLKKYEMKYNENYRSFSV